MRFDIVFYLLATICFILAVIMIPIFGIGLISVAFFIVTLMFGLLFAAFGYSTRPRKYMRPPPPKPSTEAKSPEVPQPSAAPAITPPKPVKPATELTRIKGIGPKRVAQLKDMQVNSVEDLVQFSAEDLAKKLNVSSKITAKWMEQAVNVLKEEA